MIGVAPRLPDVPKRNMHIVSDYQLSGIRQQSRWSYLHESVTATLVDVYQRLLLHDQGAQLSSIVLPLLNERLSLR